MATIHSSDSGPESREGACAVCNQQNVRRDRSQYYYRRRHSQDVSKKGKRKPYTPRDHLFNKLREELRLQGGGSGHR